ncbi:MAG: J domain-containing protein [Rivularia sp. (in: cyanobacteria)]|jgi:DnaJ-class molecular chaperone
MKAQMNSPGFKNNQNNQKANTIKPKTDKDKINRAYNILGLKPDASSEQIKQAYKKLVKKWHPDLFVNQPQLAKAKEKIRLINEAYGILS